MFFALTIITLVHALVSRHAFAFPYKRQDDQEVSIQSTFLLQSDCKVDQISVVRQALSDALILARATIEFEHDELLAPTDYLEWDSRAALDFFGPPVNRAAYQQKIFDTFVRATQSYRGWGWSDWWNNRYVKVSCSGDAEKCLNTYGYTVNNSTAYPQIFLCPSYFDYLRSHDENVRTIRADGTGQLKRNLRNLRSQASTMLHELLHIRLSSAEVCQDGCQDEWVGVKGGSIRAYRAGPSKLLARVSAMRAAENNDNYVFFAMAKYMEKTFKYAPEFPTAWDPTKTQADNRNREAREPGAMSELELFDELAASFEESNDTDAPLVEASRYPEWYRPIITAGTTDEDLSLIEEPPGNSKPASGPTNFDDVTCEVDDGSPEIADCVHAFGSLVGVPDVRAEHNKKGETWWSGYVHSCVLAVSYTEDWMDNCQASYSDVQGHASAIFEKCQDGGRGKVGGKVVLNVPNCPAEVKIMHT